MTIARASSSRAPGRGTGGIVFGLFFAAGSAAALLASSGGMPWLGRAGETIAPCICGGSSIAGVLAAFLTYRRSIARFGRVTFETEEIVFSRRDWRVTRLHVDQLAGYRDGDSEFVEVVRRAGVPASPEFPRLTIPTPTEKDRVRVLHALDARGLQRLE